jgi:hypothetical protein
VLEGAVHEEDGVLGDEPHEQDDPDVRPHAERVTRHGQCQQRADQGERQGQHDRERVDERLELAGEHDVDEDDGEAEREGDVRQTLSTPTERGAAGGEARPRGENSCPHLL